jgi:hypothetical protein
MVAIFHGCNISWLQYFMVAIFHGRNILVFVYSGHLATQSLNDTTRALSTKNRCGIDTSIGIELGIAVLAPF